ncbi:MAG: hypothetical protein Q7R87_04185 [Nanoarchaeota archaeon]|nr:hypothetical protein [Nanoarchaeota archaeon]
MERRPYAGVIKEFMERRQALIGARRGTNFYHDVDTDTGLPTYGLKNIKTGLTLNLVVPNDRSDLASLKLLPAPTDDNPLPASLVRVDFDWRSNMIHRVRTIEPKNDTYFGRLAQRIGGNIVHPGNNVLTAYDALDNMFQIMAEKRKRVIDNQLGLNRQSSTTASHDYLFTLNG